MELTTSKATFTPNTHRTIQLNPHTSSSVPVPGAEAGNGFLGLFATLSNKAGGGQDTTSAPLYLGNIDLKDLQSFQQFQQVKGTRDDLQEYLRLKKMLEEKRKKTSRNQILSKLKQNRRMSVEPEDDPEQKIRALNLLVKSNINEALLNQKSDLLRSSARSKASSGHMSYVIPSADSLHSQVEKPSLPLQNSLPFLGQDPSQYNSQSIMINPPANIDLTSLRPNTPNPVSSDVQSTLPFLQDNSLNALSFSSFISPGSSNPHNHHSPALQLQNTQTNFGTSFVTPSSLVLPSAPVLQNNRVFAANRNDQNYFGSLPHQNNVYNQGSFNTPPPAFVSHNYNINDLDSHLQQAKEEQKILESQLKQLQEVEANLKRSQQRSYSTATPQPTQALIHSGSKVPRTLGGFPMNFEDMLTTGLQFAKQSQQNSVHQTSQYIGESINPRHSVQQVQQPSWQSAASVQIPQNTNHLPVSGHTPDGFTPSQIISQKIVQPGPRTNTNSNSLQSDQIHIIGPNCYVMTPGGFKPVGKAPACLPSKPSKGSDGSDSNRSRNSGRSSIWDSINSIPLVSKFTRTFGIK